MRPIIRSSAIPLVMFCLCGAIVVSRPAMAQQEIGKKVDQTAPEDPARRKALQDLNNEGVSGAAVAGAKVDIQSPLLRPAQPKKAVPYEPSKRNGRPSGKIGLEHRPKTGSHYNFLKGQEEPAHQPSPSSGLNRRPVMEKTAPGSDKPQGNQEMAREHSEERELEAHDPCVELHQPAAVEACKKKREQSRSAQ
jgi:hypothetical protein